MTIKDRSVIAGAGTTEWAKHIDRSEIRLALEAIRGALDDAAIDPAHVDGLCSYTMETTEEVEIARNLG
ncbi:MAG: lipid-transfer protein, partial [Acidimicrobiales bacterium]